MKTLTVYIALLLSLNTYANQSDLQLSGALHMKKTGSAEVNLDLSVRKISDNKTKYKGHATLKYASRIVKAPTALSVSHEDQKVEGQIYLNSSETIWLKGTLSADSSSYTKMSAKQLRAKETCRTDRNGDRNCIEHRFEVDKGELILLQP